MIHIILPAYNEEENILSLMESINYSMREASIDFKIVVVNDGSSDKTADIVKSMQHKIPVELINHNKNMGLGEAIRSGFTAGLNSADERNIIITMDADNSHRPELILKMIAMIREGADVVIASRYQPGSRTKGIPLSRVFLSRAASTVMRILFPIRGVKDYTNGYRAYRADVLRRAFETYGKEFVSETGFSCMIEILLKLRALDLVMTEVPMILRYDKKKGDSKMNVSKTIINTLKLISRRMAGR